MKELPIRGNKFECCAAIGKFTKHGRKIIALAIYMPPDMPVQENKEKFDNPLIIAGGDINKVQPDELFGRNLSMEFANTGPTRGNSCLDYVFSNYPIEDVELCPPPTECIWIPQ